MGKRRGEKKIQQRLRKRKTRWIVAVAALSAVGWFAWKEVGTKDASRLSSGDPAASASYVRRETGSPLSPALFVGKTAVAYQVAQEIPSVLDQLYCYCECDRHMGHATLLSCFVDSHAAN